MFFNKEILMGNNSGDEGGSRITAPSGRILYRHRSGKGTVMEFNDGQPRKVLIADSTFRANRRFGTYGKDSSLPNYTSHPSQQWYLNKDSSMTTTKAATITDSWLNTNMVRDTNTSKYNCDVWMTYKGTSDSTSNYGYTGVPAVEWCRSQNIDGQPLDLPNIQILMRIYCDAEALDALDPTIATNPKYALGSKNPQGAWYMGTAGSSGNSSNAYTYYSWSSSEYNGSTTAWGVNYNGYVNDYRKFYEFSVVPVLEL